MKNKEILEVLDELDIYMLNNLQIENVLQNPQDMVARMFIGKMKLIENELRNKKVPTSIKNRFDITHTALMYATKKGVRSSDSYFRWIKQTRNTLSKNTNNLKTQEALNTLLSDCATGHIPNQNSLDFLNMQIGKLTQIQQQILSNCGRSIWTISSEYNQFIEKDNQQLIVVQPKKTIFTKILNFFKGKEDEKHNSEKIINNGLGVEVKKEENAASRYRNSQKIPNFELKHQVPEIKELPQMHKKQIIAVSDLHGNMEKWEIVKKYIKENPNSKCLILGDAMDRGDYGPEILLQIKELSEEGKVQYIPGNHDIFAYNYLKMRNNKNTSAYYRAKLNLENNGGDTTMQKLDSFYALVDSQIKKGNIKNNITIDELTQWLGKQPIQKKLNENEFDYAIAHAMFDEKLYNADPEFNLEKALNLEMNGGKESEIYNRFLNCMWYREEDPETHYADIAFPPKHFLLAGHTRQRDINLGHIQGDPTKGKAIIDTGLGKFAGWNLTQGVILNFDERIQNER